MNSAAGPQVELHLAAGVDLHQLEALGQAERVQEVVAAVWQFAKADLSAQLEVALMGQEEHCRVHQRFLNDPSPTDVMAFPYQDEELFGEVLINVDMARAQAQERGHEALWEATLYLVHGCLHLVGYDDQTDEERARMRAAESAVMEILRD